MLTHRMPLMLAVVVATITLGCSIERTTAPAVTSDEGTALALREKFESGAESSAAGVEVTLSEPTGWATLTGRFRMNGTPPRLAALAVDKDRAICAPGGTQILEETVVVSATGGIKDVLIYLVTKIPKDAPKWEHESYLANKTGEVIFDQRKCVFLSHVFPMRSTQTLKILNSDPVGHNTNIQAGRGAIPFNGLVGANGYATYQPGGQTDRPFPVACSIHPWMSAYMITRDSPYFAVTDANGDFEIANVPTGVELEFRVWQQAPGFIDKVTVNDSAETWRKGRFSVTLTDGETHEMNVSVDASLFD